MELHQASKQWSSRPADQRFTSLTALHQHVADSRENSRGAVLSSRAITVQPVGSQGLEVIGPNGNPVAPTNWAFGQLAQRAKAPAGYLRKLPAPMAADCLNYGLHVDRDIEEIGILLHKNGGAPELRAVTGPNYGRIWNSTITSQLINQFGDGVTGDWRVPGEFGKRVEITRENTTLYASDRDLWVFLADEDRRIEIPNRRNGESGSLARGFFLWNSEVGSSTFGLSTFLFDYACCNRIVWGAKNYKQITIRHTSGAPDRWLERVKPALSAYAQSSTQTVVDTVAAAQRTKIEKLDEFLNNRFSRSQSSAIKAAHMSEEQRPIETIWDAATGITAYAKTLQYQDSRVGLERTAGKVLDLVAV